ncbi:MAG TPA: hypothetical protein P5256_00490 [Beijerinckiaceae bacterium]|nr:hypothetical protein [Methylobacteriaceae bacterium]HRY01574.1 hypothetical protein [Beijerinckiaceae bacterium]
MTPPQGGLKRYKVEFDPRHRHVKLDKVCIPPPLAHRQRRRFHFKEPAMKVLVLADKEAEPNLPGLLSRREEIPEHPNARLRLRIRRLA